MPKCQAVCTEKKTQREAELRCPSCGKYHCPQCALAGGIASDGLSIPVTLRCVYCGSKLVGFGRFKQPPGQASAAQQRKLLRLRCPHCKKPLNVSHEFRGKKARCPGCKGVLMIPKSEEKRPRPSGRANPKKAKACADKGLAHLNNGRHSKAFAAFTKAVDYDSDNPVWWTNRGAVCMLFVEQCAVPYVGTDFRIMIHLFDASGRMSQEGKALARTGHDAEFLAGLETCLRQAEADLKQAAKRESEAGTALYWLAILYRNTGRFEQAIEGFRRVSDSGCSDAEAAAESLDAMDKPALKWDVLNADGPDISDGAKYTFQVNQLFGKELKSLSAQISI